MEKKRAKKNLKHPTFLNLPKGWTDSKFSEYKYRLWEWWHNLTSTQQAEVDWHLFNEGGAPGLLFISRPTFYKYANLKLEEHTQIYSDTLFSLWRIVQKYPEVQRKMGLLYPSSLLNYSIEEKMDEVRDFHLAKLRKLVPMKKIEKLCS